MCFAPRSGRSRPGYLRQPRFDGPPHLVVELTRVSSDWRDRFADHHANRTGLLDETAARPKLPRIVRKRNHELAGCGGEQRTADTEFLRLARLDPRAFRKHDDPQTFREPCLALLDDLIHCTVALAPVDGDGPEQFEAPADEGYPQQFTFQIPNVGWKDHELRDGLPRRGVVAHDDVIARGNVFAPKD